MKTGIPQVAVRLKNGNISNHRKEVLMAIINCAAKCRAYPNKAQTELLQHTLSCCRFVYNHMLERNNKVYKRRGEHLSYITMQNLLPKMKKFLPWLKDADSQALKYACRQVDTAFQKFFKHETDHPTFHSKKGRQSYTTTNNTAIHISNDRKKVKLPIVGWIKIRGLHMAENALINYATVSFDPDGSFYVSINYKYEADIPAPGIVKPSVLGLDYKSDGLYVDSDGNCAEMPHWFRESQAKLARQQRRLSKKRGSRKGERKSSGWHKQHRKVSTLQSKIAHQRHDYLHKLSKVLAETYDTVAIEDLDMKSMSNKDFGNGKATMDNGYGMFTTMLEYKFAWNGKRLVKVDRWFPSSQICSCCGYQNKNLKDLRIRRWQCPNCGVEHDRDINAAVNIKNKALRLMKAVA